jgi:hypothetical protein
MSLFALLSFSLTPWQFGGKLRYAYDPCPIMARSVPPGRLRACTGSLYQRRRAACAGFFVASVLTRLLCDLFSPGGAPLGADANAGLYETSHFSLTAPERRYRPLYVDFAAVAQRRVFGLFATPVSFRLTQNPLGAVLLPQALVPVGTLRHRRSFR